MIRTPQLAAFRYKNYTLTWLANLFSGAALWTVIVASGWLLFTETNSSSWVGILTFSSMFPLLIASPVGGLIGDKYDRKKIVVFMFIASSLIVLFLAILSMTGILHIMHLVTIAFLGGIARAIKEPSIQALIPNQVPDEHLLNAITLNGATKHGARFLIVAPLAAVDSVGTDGMLLIAALLYGVGAIIMLRVSTVSSGETRSEYGLLKNMFEGVSYIYTHRTLALFIILVAFHCALVMSFESMLPRLSEQKYDANDASLFGYLIMGFGAGSLVGMGLIAGVTNDKYKGNILMLTGIASGVTPILLILSGNILVAIIMASAMGASQATFMAITNTYVQSIAPDRLRGRISSLYVMHAGGVMAFSNLGYGFIADRLTVPPIFVVTGLTFIIIMLVSYAAEPMLRRVYTTGSITWT